MFLSHFNLAEQPFGATPDPHFLFATSSHREALASLYCGFHGNRGFTALVAESGLGKTTLLFEFLEGIRDYARTVFLFDTLCEPDDILSFILHDLGTAPAPTAVERHRQLNDILATEARAGRRVALVIDEAQNLSSRTLEAVRLLTNFETSRFKLMHVVLSGQPELADKLSRAEAAQLFQRVSTLCRLRPFTPEEINAYIAHRLKVAGYAGSALFSRDAIELLSEASRGIPRIINTLCFNSLVLCRARNSRLVDRAMVAEAIADLRLPVSGQPAPVLQADTCTLTPVPFFRSSEDHLSTNKPAKYLAAALLGMCAALAGVYTWNMRGEARALRSRQGVAPASTQSHVTKEIASGERPATTLESRVERTRSEGKLALSSATRVSDSAAPSQITVLAGDTLEGIAKERLGTFNHAVLHQIEMLNPRITDPNHIESGSMIRLPGRSGSTESNKLARTQP